MSESKHTPGLIKQRGAGPNSARDLWADNINIGECYATDNHDHRDYPPLAEAFANARRIVALWNAAEELGLSTKAIEAGAIKAMSNALHMIAEADVQPGHVAYLSKSRMAGLAFDAIAKAEGGE